MFENLGQKLQTILIGLVIAVLVVVMGVFGFANPSAEGCNVEGASVAATVYDDTITEGEFNAALMAAQLDRVPPADLRVHRVRERLLEGLIERSLLVREARRLGFTATEDEVMRRVSEDEVVLLTGPVNGPRGVIPSGPIPQGFSNRDGEFRTDYLERFIQFRLRRSVEEFVEWQIEETLAERVRETVTAPVTVSPREVWDSYVHDTERATLSYVRFNPTYYRDRVEVTDEALTAWMGENTEEIDREYTRRAHQYRDLEEQVRASHILFRVEENASDEDKAAVRREAEGVLRRALAGDDFAALAREHSADGSAARGGDLGWFARGRMVAAFEQAAFGLADGAVTPELVESQFGFHIIKRIGHREGDVPVETAKREIGDELFRRARATEIAHEEANRALAYLREGHTTEELDERLRNDWAESTEAPAEPEEAEAPAEGEEAAGEETAEAEPAEERDPNAPQVRQTSSFGRGERAIPGPFDSSPLTTAAFEMTTGEPLPDEPVQLGDDWFVYRLDERTEATREGFTDEVRTRLEQTLVGSKRHEVLSAYIGRLRHRAEEEGEIRITEDFVNPPDEEDEEGEDEEEEEEASASR